jgi:GH24 family phage-related lysozyme (muramidase)
MTMLALKHAVGGAVNHERPRNDRGDVRLVQRLLVAHGQYVPALRYVAIDGHCGPGTVQAIKDFQRLRARLTNPDGVVSPGSATWQQLISGLKKSTAGRTLDLKAHAARLATADFERFVEHIYLDSLGLTTVGIGTLLEQVENDLDSTVDFVVKHHVELVSRKTGRRATREEVRKDVEACWKVWDQTSGTPDWRRYGSVTELKILATHSQTLCEQHLARDVDHLRHAISGFDRLPVPAREALLDLHYNIGPKKFVRHKWPSLFAAVAAGDFFWAAEESNRPQVQQARNRWTSERFIDAANELPA